MSKAADMAAAMAEERRTQLRPMEVRAPDDRDAPYSGGVVITICTSANQSMSFDINPREARDLRDKLHEFISALPESAV